MKEQNTSVGCPDALTVQEFCELAGFTRQWLYARFWGRGEGPPRVVRKIGSCGRVLIPRETGLQWLVALLGSRVRAKITQTAVGRHITHERKTT